MLLFLEDALLTDFFQVAICYSRPVARNRSAFQVPIRPKATRIKSTLPSANLLADVRVGSKSEVRMLNREVGFALNNGHRQPGLSGPKSANRRNLDFADCREMGAPIVRGDRAGPPLRSIVLQSLLMPPDRQASHAQPYVP